jgi:uncharacterized protein (UPF0303 family)
VASDPGVEDPTAQQLIDQERRLQPAHFGHDQAWQLGTLLVDLAQARRLGVSIAINLGAQEVFRAGLAGSSHDNDGWLKRKFETVARFSTSSLAVRRRLGNDADAYALNGLDPKWYALAGGAFPLRVNGLIVGAVGVSGLHENDDHSLVIEALQSFLT